ncbi:MAG TPA: glutamate--tRNA ligase [Acidimicrobiaceae bacterium]|nr:glutamate--tRNA ligase [Acidimicrobiaceae bacterium]
MTPPKLRFAPAPTGYLHLGSARTALFNWLCAKQSGGTLVLRIEDTNADLVRPGMLDDIFSTLDWLGITFDGEPIHQSRRADLYAAAVDGWLDAGLAYERDGAVRFTVPDDGATEFDDVVRGHVSVDNAGIADFVVRRSDGTATFAVANAVDDLDLGITHIVRGEDMLNVTPQVVLLRRALGEAEPPVYAHLPLILNEQRKKLSKRRDDVAVRDYRARGVLPEALVNYLALLGWGPPDNVEIRPIDEIAELFRLENVNAAPAVFDPAKLEAVNGAYIRQLTPAQFAAAFEPFAPRDEWADALSAGGAADESTQSSERLSARLSARLVELAPLVQERTRLLADAPGQLDFFFADPDVDGEAWGEAWSAAVGDAGDDAGGGSAKATTPEQARAILAGLAEAVAAFGDWEADALQAELRRIAEELDLKLRVAQAPVRVAVTGRSVGPPLFESMELLGRAETLKRLGAALARLPAG